MAPPALWVQALINIEGFHHCSGLMDRFGRQSPGGLPALDSHQRRAGIGSA
jgi:hypothetical protein